MPDSGAGGEYTPNLMGRAAWVVDVEDMMNEAIRIRAVAVPSRFH